MRLRNRADAAMAWVDRESGAWVVLGMAMLLYGAAVLWLGRGTTIFADEYQFFVEDRGADVETLIAPLNGHLELGSRVLYAVMFELFGADDFLAARLFQILGATLAAGCLFVLVKRRLPPAIALMASLLVLLLGSAWEVTFIVSGLTHVWSVAAGLGALLVLDRGGRRADLLVCVLLVISVAWFTFGVAFAAGAAVWILLGPGARRRIWVAAVPLGLYVAWFVWLRAVYVPDHGEVHGAVGLATLLTIPSFIAHEAASVAGVMTGLDYPFARDVFLDEFKTESVFGPAIALAGAVALAVRLRRRPPTTFLWVALAVLAVGWIGLSLGAANLRTPDLARYTYFGAVAVLVVAAEAARGWRPTAAAKWTLAALLAVALLGNLARLRDGADVYRQLSLQLRAQLGALELSRTAISPEFSSTAGLTVITTGPYFDAVDRIGSPAFSASELGEQRDTISGAADQLIVKALGVRLEPLGDADRPQDCERIEADGAEIALERPAGGVALRVVGAAAVSVRRYADAETQPLGDVAPDAQVAVRIPPDDASQPWTVVVAPSAVAVTACSL